jgi:biotin transporter BioY
MGKTGGYIWGFVLLSIGLGLLATSKGNSGFICTILGVVRLARTAMNA